MHLRRRIVETPGDSRQALDEHREKDPVHAGQSPPEVHLAPEIIHLAAEPFREPIIDSPHQRDDASGDDHVMKVPDHVIGVVQVNVGHGQTQRQARQASDAEHGQECEGK